MEQWVYNKISLRFSKNLFFSCGCISLTKNSTSARIITTVHRIGISNDANFRLASCFHKFYFNERNSYCFDTNQNGESMSFIYCCKPQANILIWYSPKEFDEGEFHICKYETTSYLVIGFHHRETKRVFPHALTISELEFYFCNIFWWSLEWKFENKDDLSFKWF